MKKQYMILDRDTIGRLEIAVDEALGQGWECQGGVSVAAPVNDDRTTWSYCQAMIKEE